LLEGTADHVDHFFRNEGLGNIVKRTGFDDIHGGLDIGIAGDNDDDSVGVDLLDLFQHFSAFFVAKPEIA